MKTLTHRIAALAIAVALIVIGLGAQPAEASSSAWINWVTATTAVTQGGSFYAKTNIGASNLNTTKTIRTEVFDGFSQRFVDHYTQVNGNYTDYVYVGTDCTTHTGTGTVRATLYENGVYADQRSVTFRINKAAGCPS